MSDERFEAIFANKAGLKPEDVAAMWNGSVYSCRSYPVALAWDFWIAGSKSAPICDCYGSMFKEDKSLYAPCPRCGENLVDVPGGGLRCPKKSCGYWFC